MNWDMVLDNDSTDRAMRLDTRDDGAVRLRMTMKDLNASVEVEVMDAELIGKMGELLMSMGPLMGMAMRVHHQNMAEERL